MKQLTGKNWAVPYRRKGRASGPGPVWATPESLTNARRLRSVIADMMELQGNGTLSKEQSERLVALACSAYIGQEVEKRVGNVLEEILAPERLARYLPLP